MFDLEYEEEGDGLGYYDDGVKRTLTDEQIEMFRHTEREQLIRDGLLAREELINTGAADSPATNGIDASADSPASSIEEELLHTAPPTLSVPPAQKVDRQPYPSTQSEISQNSAAMRRDRGHEVPYGKRYKRKWEAYIEDTDAQHGSRTHRRIIRELDEQRTEDIELDY